MRYSVKKVVVRFVANFDILDDEIALILPERKETIIGVVDWEKREVIDIGCDVTKVEDGRITFLGDEEAVARANIFLRTAEMVAEQRGKAVEEIL